MFSHQKIYSAVRRIEAIGVEQYNTSHRLTECTIPITEVLSKNMLALFSSPPIKTPSKHKMQITALKSDYNFSHDYSYIACQTRDGDLDTFFKHENQNTPLPLSLRGKIRLGTKADFLHCLQLEKSKKRMPLWSMPSSLMVQLLSRCFILAQLRPFKSMLVQYSHHTYLHN